MRLSDPTETVSTLMLSTEGITATALGAYLKVRGVAEGPLAILSWEGTRTQVGSRRDETWRVLRKFGAVSLGGKVGDSWMHHRFSGPYLRDALLDMGYLVETLETCTGWRELPPLRESIKAALSGALSDGGPGPLIWSHLSHVYDTGGPRRTHLRGHQNILKRLLVHAGAFNLGLLMRQVFGRGTPRGLQGGQFAPRALEVAFAMLVTRAWMAVTRLWPVSRSLPPVLSTSWTAVRAS
jgi:hypothetical protein